MNVLQVRSQPESNVTVYTCIGIIVRAKYIQMSNIIKQLHWKNPCQKIDFPNARPYQLYKQELTRRKTPSLSKTGTGCSMRIHKEPGHEKKANCQEQYGQLRK